MSTRLRLATWNVNSIRSRVDRVVEWLDDNDVDVLALQETKCRDREFPYDVFDHAGYEVAHNGFSQWNGVAIASRVGLADVATSFANEPGFDRHAADALIPMEVVEARALGATCGGVRVWSVYVPNGRALDDPHFEYKLAWLQALRVEAARWIADDPAARIALAGDWNIAPTDDDVWSPKFFDGTTHTSPVERAAFDAILDAGYTEVTRPFVPHEYTFWDYTKLRFPRNEGVRIDFVLASDALRADVSGARIDRNERDRLGASDHAPVIVDIDC